jgi:hypothetical protein
VATARKVGSRIQKMRTPKRKRRKISKKRRKLLLRLQVRGNHYRRCIAEYAVYHLNIACSARKTSLNAKNGSRLHTLTCSNRSMMSRLKLNQKLKGRKLRNSLNSNRRKRRRSLWLLQVIPILKFIRPKEAVKK